VGVRRKPLKTVGKKAAADARPPLLSRSEKDGGGKEIKQLVGREGKGSPGRAMRGSTVAHGSVWTQQPDGM